MPTSYKEANEMQKSQTATENTTAQRSPRSADGQISFMFDEVLLNKEHIKHIIRNIQSPVLVTGHGVSDPNVVHVFDSQEAFEQWAQTTKFAAKFTQMHKAIASLQRRHRMNDLSALKREKPVFDRVFVDPISSETDGFTGDELVEGPDGSFTVPGGAKSDIAVLYESPDYNGRWFPMGPTALPNLSVVGMHQQVSSLRLTGICMLCDQTWFRGARLYLVGDPLLQVDDLQDWGFNDRAASAIVL